MEFDTCEKLGEAVGVGRRRVTKWRTEGAPQTLDAQAWYDWLCSKGKSRYAKKLQASLPDTTPIFGRESAPREQGLPADGGAQGAHGEYEQGALSDEESDLGLLELKKIKLQEDIVSKRQLRLKADNVLMHIDDFEKAIQLFGVHVVKSLGNDLWNEMRPVLDALSASDRRRLRAAHDRGVLSVRAGLSRSTRDVLMSLVDA